MPNPIKPIDPKRPPMPKILEDIVTRKKFIDLMDTNFNRVRGRIGGAARTCSCSGCECPGGDIAAIGSASVVGYAGGYAGDNVG